MITTDSYMELYGTLIGWYFYDQSWQLIVGTGLVFLLVFFWIYTNWRGPATSQEARAGFGTSVSRMEWDVYGGILIIFLFAWPVVPLTVNQLEFELENGQRVDINENPSTFDGFFPDGTFPDVRVPVFWHGAMQILAGVNSALIGATPEIQDFRKALTTLDYGFIKDPQLRQEVDRFYEECFRPALARYQNAKEGVEIDIDDGSEPFWPGSRSLWNWYGRGGCPAGVQGCQPALRAESPVSGFPTAVGRDVEPEYFGVDDARRSTVGRPYCTQWWGQSGTGLDNRLLQVARDQGMEVGFLASLFTGLSQIEENDIAVRRLLENRPVLSTTNSQTAYADSDRGLIAGLANRAVNIVGIEISTILRSSGLYGGIRVLPILQGLLLMLLYASAAFLMLLPGFRLASLVALLTGLFAIKFLSVLWHYAYWIEQFFIGTVIDEDMLAVQVHGQILDGQLINYLLLFSYAVLPAAFMVLMGVVGFRAASGITSAIGSAGQNAARAGDLGTKVTATAGSRVAKSNMRNGSQ